MFCLIYLNLMLTTQTGQTKCYFFDGYLCRSLGFSQKSGDLENEQVCPFIFEKFNFFSITLVFSVIFFWGRFCKLPMFCKAKFHALFVSTKMFQKKRKIKDCLTKKEPSKLMLRIIMRTIHENCRNEL